MECAYFLKGDCRSCTWMGVPYPQQLSQLEQYVRQQLPHVSSSVWEPTYAGPEAGFRNKAKLVVGGHRGAISLGIEGSERSGVDLRHCGLHEPALQAAIPVIADLVDVWGLTPYEISRRSGEFKHLQLVCSPDGRLMVRFVLRSEGQAGRIRARLDQLRSALPTTEVVTINLLPGHVAALEGPDEEVLTQETQLKMPLGDVVLFVHPQGFFQTNTAVARELYRTAARWALAEDPPRVALDLYCGVGGFAMHVASGAPEMHVRGIEVSPGAIEAARRGADANGLSDRVRFDVGTAEDGLKDTDLVIVNPPRRGLGGLAELLQARGPHRVLYSSCNPETLGRDLAVMSSYAVARARVFDMFPQTRHCEVLVDLRRRTPSS